MASWRDFTLSEQDTPLPPLPEKISDAELLTAADRLLTEGVEFEQFIRHMNTLLNEAFGIIFVRGAGSAWYAKRHGFKIVPLLGDKDYWLSAADLLMDMITLIQGEQP